MYPSIYAASSKKLLEAGSHTRPVEFHQSNARQVEIIPVWYSTAEQTKYLHALLLYRILVILVLAEHLTGSRSVRSLVQPGDC